MKKIMSIFFLIIPIIALISCGFEDNTSNIEEKDTGIVVTGDTGGSNADGALADDSGSGNNADAGVDTGSQNDTGSGTSDTGVIDDAGPSEDSEVADNAETPDDADSETDTGEITDVEPTDDSGSAEDDAETPEDIGAEDIGESGDAEDTGADTGLDGGVSVDTGVQQQLKGCVEGTFQPFRGNLHSHSTSSDGDGSPEEAFTHARDVAHLDIMVLTDHMEQLYWPLDDYDECHKVADSFYVPGTYLTDCGFEYATSLFGLTGHNNIYYSSDLFPLAADFSALYTELAKRPDAIGQFNHPGDSDGHTWNNFEYNASADANLNLIEFNTGADPWMFFFMALDKGWHVSPCYNQDNHGKDWGSKDDRRSGFYMTDLSREALHDAMRNRRSFMTHDKNASITLMAEGKCWMGSILTGAKAVTMEAKAEDQDATEGFATMELFGPGQLLLTTISCGGTNPCTATLPVTVNASTYVVARAIELDGDILVSAPIWVAP